MANKTGRTLRYLMEHAGADVTASEVLANGLVPTIQAAKSELSRLLMQGRIVRTDYAPHGRARNGQEAHYQYQVPAAPEPERQHRTFQVFGEAHDGEPMLLEEATGMLFVLVPLGRRF